MNAYPSNRVSESDCFTKAGVLRHPVFAIALIAGGLNISAARADNTNQLADSVFFSITFPPTPSCDATNCPDCSGYVTISRMGECPGGICPLSVSKSFKIPGLPRGVVPDSLMLYKIQTDTCTGDNTNVVVNLLGPPGPPTLPMAEWLDMAKYASATPGAPGGWVVIADFGVVELPEAQRAVPVHVIGSGNPSKGVPTLSEWAVVLMTLSLITAGTILFGRSRRRARTA